MACQYTEDGRVEFWEKPTRLDRLAIRLLETTSRSGGYGGGELVRLISHKATFFGLLEF